MKQLPLFVMLGFALSLCNLTNKFRSSSNSNEPGTATSGSSSSGPAERAQATSAQTAALAGGKEIQWDQQGMSFTVPPKWTETTNESKSFGWSSPGGFDGAHLIVSISTMDESFATESSINAYYEGARSRAKNGEVDEFKWVEIDGLKGVQFRESKPEKDDDFRRLQWLAYRKYAGQVQFVNVMLSSSGKGFTQHQDEMYGILYSMKLIH